jgi:Ser/Thr protein kinase RdoA (MazF antagonist)
MQFLRRGRPAIVGNVDDPSARVCFAIYAMKMPPNRKKTWFAGHSLTHIDLKSHNIVLGEQNDVLIIDFGRTGVRYG